MALSKVVLLRVIQAADTFEGKNNLLRAFHFPSSSLLATRTPILVIDSTTTSSKDDTRLIDHLKKKQLS